MVIAVEHEPEFPNWFRVWCNNCQQYTEQPHRCTTPGEQAVETARSKLEQWLTPPYTHEET